MKVLIVIFGVVFFFVGMGLIKRLQILNFIKNPPLTGCDKLDSFYKDEEWQSIAYIQWKTASAALKDERFSIVTANMPELHCFCNYHIDQLGKPKETLFPHRFSDPKDFVKTLTETAPICERYEHYTSGLNFVLRYLYTYLIVIASYGFRTLFIWISDLLGFESRTA